MSPRLIFDKLDFDLPPLTATLLIIVVVIITRVPSRSLSAAGVLRG